MDTIKQKTLVVEGEDGKRITVRRLRWKSAREFLRKLAAAVVPIYQAAVVAKQAAAPTPVAAADPAPAPRSDFITYGELILAELPSVVANTDDLVETLLVGTTDLKPEELGELDVVTVAKVIAAAMSINCDAELKNSWAGIVAAAKAIVPAPRTTTTS